MAAIDGEIRALGEASLRQQLRPLITWTESVFGDTGPFAIVKRKAGRFRLPRAFKTELIDRFVDADGSPATQLTTLIVVAHPDDESIGAGARLNRLGNAWIVEITNGAPDDLECARRHGFDTSEEYADARRRELDQALAIAGFPLDRVMSLGYTDGELSLRLA